MNEPIFRWECTICDAAGVSPSAEMARLTVNAHVSAAHPPEPPPRPVEPESQRAR